jgi:hypothetical protein
LETGSPLVDDHTRMSLDAYEESETDKKKKVRYLEFSLVLTLLGLWQ